MAKKRNQFNIVRLSITLQYVVPTVARRMDVRADTHLEDLHLYIQAAMGWENCHLWGFDAKRHGQSAHWSLDDFNEELDATLLDVIRFLQGKPEFTYIYDYGTPGHTESESERSSLRVMTGATHISSPAPGAVRLRTSAARGVMTNSCGHSRIRIRNIGSITPGTLRGT